VLCAATQGVPPEEYRSQGPAATREPVARRPRVSTQVRSSLGRENMSDHFWKGNSGAGAPVSVWNLLKRSLTGTEVEQLCRQEGRRRFL